MDSDRMESARMSNSANPESDRMDSGRMESDRISNSANPESDRMDPDRMESDRMSNSANPESDRIESGRNQLKKKSGGRHRRNQGEDITSGHSLQPKVPTVSFSYSIFTSYCYLHSLTLSFTYYK
jgi:hypothetical protein